MLDLGDDHAQTNHLTEHEFRHFQPRQFHQFSVVHRKNPGRSEKRCTCPTIPIEMKHHRSIAVDEKGCVSCAIKNEGNARSRCSLMYLEDTKKGARLSTFPDLIFQFIFSELARIAGKLLEQQEQSQDQTTC